MNETEMTVEILDHYYIGKFAVYSDSDLIKFWEIDTRILVGLRRGGFVGGTGIRTLLYSNSFWNGFAMLENLAVCPKFAAKLAEPINP
jgi:hypothetical protein